MPCTRSTNKDELLELSDDDFDPDYSEGSDSSVDDLPKTMYRDRAGWIEQNVEDLEFMYREFLVVGRAQFGNAFFQTGSITTFANFVYKHSTPFSDTLEE